MYVNSSLHEPYMQEQANVGGIYSLTILVIRNLNLTIIFLNGWDLLNLVIYQTLFLRNSLSGKFSRHTVKKKCKMTWTCDFFFQNLEHNNL